MNKHIFCLDFKCLASEDGLLRHCLVYAARISALVIFVILIAFVATRDSAPRITVEWNSSTTERIQLERLFQLVDRQARTDEFYDYDLIDTSTENIRALISHAAVRSLQGVNIDTYRPLANGQKGRSRIWIGDRLPIIKTPFVAPILFMVLLVVLVIPTLFSFFASRYSHDRNFVSTQIRISKETVRSIRTRIYLILRSVGFVNGVVQFIGTRVHSITARELGFFRVWFAVMLWVTFWALRLPHRPFPREFHLDRALLANWEWVHWMASQPSVVLYLEQGILISIVVFGFGLWTRATYPFLALQLTVWTLIRLQHTSVHPWGVALVTVLALLTIRWSDGFSLDETIRRLRGQNTYSQRRGRSYGFALWLPGLVLGTAMAAAGVSKLRSSGFEWIYGGAVKYHFVIDAVNAPTEWGLWIATHHTWAVIFSLLAVGSEISLGFSPIIRTYLRRLPLAFVGLSLLSGFYLFQNEFWAAWWMLWALYFLPWPTLLRLIRGWIPAHVVIIDGDCPRCRGTGRLLRALDWFDRLHLVTVNDALNSRTLIKEVERDELLTSMYVVCSNGTYVKGYRAYLHIGMSLLPLWPLLPIAVLPGIRHLGEIVYTRLAATRPRRFPVACPISPRHSSCMRLTLLQVWVVALICVLQGTASLLRLELEPIMSDYPMYSSTYVSTDDFDRRVETLPTYSFIGQGEGRRENFTAILKELELDDILRDSLLEFNQKNKLGKATETIRQVSANIEEATSISLEQIELRANYRAFDWEHGYFYWKSQDELVVRFVLRNLD